MECDTNPRYQLAGERKSRWKSLSARIPAPSITQSPKLVAWLAYGRKEHGRLLKTCLNRSLVSDSALHVIDSRFSKASKHCFESSIFLQGIIQGVHLASRIKFRKVSKDFRRSGCGDRRASHCLRKQGVTITISGPSRVSQRALNLVRQGLRDPVIQFCSDCSVSY